MISFFEWFTQTSSFFVSLLVAGLVTNWIALSQLRRILDEWEE